MGRRSAAIGLGVYGVAAAVLLLAPGSYGDSVQAIADVLARLFGLGGFGSGWVEFVANILLFTPLGFLLTVLLYPRWWAVPLAIALSACVELAQIVIPSRQPSLRDVLANSLGALGGALVALLVIGWRARRRRRRERISATV